MKKWEEEKRNMTLQESLDEFGKAWGAFVEEVAKASGIRRFMGYLTRKIEERRK